MNNFKDNKKAKIIALVLVVALSLVFIGVGIALSVKDNSYDGTVYTGTSYDKRVEPYETYDYKFTCYISGDYYIYYSGASYLTVNDADNNNRLYLNNTNNSSFNGQYFGLCKKVYLYSGNEYVISFRTNSTELSFILVRE